MLNILQRGYLPFSRAYVALKRFSVIKESQLHSLENVLVQECKYVPQYSKGSGKVYALLTNFLN